MSELFNVRAALRQRLLQVAGLPDDHAWENEGYDPTPGTPWLKEKLMPASTAVASFGSNGASDGLLRDDGVWQITVFYPAGKGTKAAEQMASAICQAFRPGLSGFLTYGGTTVVSRKAQAGPAMPEPDWYGIPISVTYYLHRPNS